MPDSSLRLGAYAESMPVAELTAPHTLELVARYGLSVAYAVQLPQQTIDPNDKSWSGLRAWIELYAERGGRGLFWPLLPREQGYWLNERNVAQFRQGLLRLLDWADACGLRLPGLVYDVEPPWQQAQLLLAPQGGKLSTAWNVVRCAIGNRNPRRFAAAVLELRSMLAAVRERIDRSYIAVFPLAMADLAAGAYRVQDLFESPVFAADYGNYNLMFYTSYLGALLGNRLSRTDLSRALFEQAGLLRKRLGPRVQITLGSTYEAVLPGKPLGTYPAPSDMTADVAAAKAAGVDELWLYCLEGVLYQDARGLAPRSSTAAGAWLDALLQTAPAEPEPSPRYTRFSRALRWLNRDRLGRRIVDSRIREV